MLHSGALVANTMAAAELQWCNMFLQASSCSFSEVLSSQKWLSGVVYTYITVAIRELQLIIDVLLLHLTSIVMSYIAVTYLKVQISIFS